MEIGYFTMPSHPPECGLKEGHDWDLQTLRWLDELGYQEAWIGEHHTAPWEPHPSPDLLLAQAFLQTKNIRLGPGGFLLPYHHPAELANRVAMLDHLSEGRLNFGVAASGLPSDWAMFNVDGMSGQNRDMTREALEIILKMWTEDAPWTYKGKYWTVNKPDVMFDFLKPHLKPKQAPHPPIGVAGLSKGSDTLKLAGERGYIPMSLNLNPAYVGSHWESVEIGAARTGRKPKRSDWRLVREVFIADTDEEAWRLSTGDMMGRMMGEYFLPLLGHFGFKDYLKATPDTPDSDVTVDYCARQQLDRGFAGHGHREDRKNLSRGRRLRHAAGVRLRLQAQARGVAPFAAAVEAGSDAAAEASRRGPDEGGVMFFSLLPCGRRWREAPDEGSSRASRTRRRHTHHPPPLRSGSFAATMRGRAVALRSLTPSSAGRRRRGLARIS